MWTVTMAIDHMQIRGLDHTICHMTQPCYCSRTDRWGCFFLYFVPHEMPHAHLANRHKITETQCFKNPKRPIAVRKI